ncbi:MAG TPA: YihY family inner membrane protein [Burkholderiales bacterium]|nr:YihY family inner membrane protein [Burkholderiales bacterium]
MRQRLSVSVPATIARLRALVDLVRERMDEERLLDTAASLTFSTLLALVPLVTIALTVFSAFPVFASLTDQIKVFLLTNLVPEAAAKVITVYGRQFVENAARLTIFGIAGLAITAVLVMHTILDAFNRIWRVRRPRSFAVRFALYWAVLTVGPILVGGSLSVTSWLLALSGDLGQVAPGVQGLLLQRLPLLLTIVALTFIYAAVPNRQVALRDALVGGVLAAVVFEVVKFGFTRYLTLFPTYTLIYGTFASLPVFLLWIYLSWLIVLIGAVVAAVLPDWRAGALAGQRHAGHQFYRVLSVLRELALAHRSGTVLSTLRLQQRAALSGADTETLLVELARSGWVCEVVRGGWVLGRDVREIMLADVFQRFVFAPLDLPVPADLTQVRDMLARIESSSGGDLAVPLSAVFFPETTANTGRGSEERPVAARAR